MKKKKKWVTAGLVPKGLTHECKDDWFCYQLCTLVNNGLELTIPYSCEYFLCFHISQDYSCVYEFARLSLFESWTWWEIASRTSLPGTVKGSSGFPLFVVVPFLLWGLVCPAWHVKATLLWGVNMLEQVTQGITSLVGFRLRVSF